MGFIFARLSRAIPFIIILAVIALVIYLIVSALRSPSRAKEILIKIFTWLSIIIIIVCLLIALYALLDHNQTVIELALLFALVGLIALVITRLCNYVFLKHHPHYKDTAQKARVIRNWPWQRK